MKRYLLAVVPLLASAQAQTRLDFWHAFTDEPRSNWIEARAAEWSEKILTLS